LSPTAAAGQQILQQLVAGQFDKVEARYNASLAAAIPPGKTAEMWSSLSRQTGPFESIVETKTGKMQGLDVTFVVCKFQKAVLDVQIIFDPDGKIAGLLARPHQEPKAAWVYPDYAKLASFTDRPLTLVNGKFELPGTLNLPKGAGPFPAVVLVHGSGPNDQDESIGADKPFKDLASGLASHGIAVFRYTKRTLKYGSGSSEDPAKLTVDDETISDARAALTLLAKQSEIDPARIFLLGHSLGGYLAPRIATGDSQIAGIIMMAANTHPVEQLNLEQIRYLVSASAQKMSAEDAQKLTAAAEDFVKKVESPDLKPGDTVTMLGSNTRGAYWLDLRDYHPISFAAQLKIPILILQGGRDYQVTPANFEDWRRALGGHKNATLKIYPDLNHLFVAGAGPSTPQEYDIPGHVAENVVADIAAWISPSPAAEKPVK
jgi:dienelactone hydrolase